MNKSALVSNLVSACGEIIGRPLTEPTLVFYCSAMAELTDERFAVAIGILRQAAKEGRLPTVSELEGVASVKDDSIEVADLIHSAITKFGLPNFEAAKAFVGEIAWAVIQRNGGWGEVCNLSYEELPARKAQWRESAKAMANKAGLGLSGQLPSFPLAQRLDDSSNRGLRSASELLTELVPQKPKRPALLTKATETVDELGF